MSRRARTELIFQEAILSGEDMAWALAGGGAAVDVCGLVSRQRKAPAPGAWSEGQPSVCYARSITRVRFGQEGENPKGFAVAVFLLTLFSLRAYNNTEKPRVGEWWSGLGLC